MVLKLEKNPRDVYLLEVEPGSKVNVKNWKDYKKRYGDDKHYLNIAVRYLEYDRPEGTPEMVGAFYQQI